MANRLHDNHLQVSLSSSPGGLVTSRTGKTDWLGHGISTAKVAARALDNSLLPGGSSLSSAIISFLELIEKKGKNKDDLQKLVEAILEIIDIVRDALDNYHHDELSRLSGFCRDLETYLLSLLNIIHQESEKGWFRGFKQLIQAHRVSENISLYQKQVRDMRDNFSLRLSIDSNFQQDSIIGKLNGLDGAVHDMRADITAIRQEVNSFTVFCDPYRGSQVYAERIHVVLQGDIRLRRILRQTVTDYRYDTTLVPTHKLSLRQRKWQPVELVEFSADVEQATRTKYVRAYRSPSFNHAYSVWRHERDLFLQLKHPNILQLYGICESPDFQALIFHDDGGRTVGNYLDSMQGLDRLAAHISLIDQYHSAVVYLENDCGLYLRMFDGDLVAGSEGRLVLTQLFGLSWSRQAALELGFTRLRGGHPSRADRNLWKQAKGQFVSFYQALLRKNLSLNHYKFLQMMNEACDISTTRFLDVKYPLGSVYSNQQQAFYEFSTPMILRVGIFSREIYTRLPARFAYGKATASSASFPLDYGRHEVVIQYTLPIAARETLLYSAYAHISDWDSKNEVIVTYGVSFHCVINLPCPLGETFIVEYPEGTTSIFFNALPVTIQNERDPASLSEPQWTLCFDQFGMDPFPESLIRALGISVEITCWDSRTIYLDSGLIHALHDACSLPRNGTYIADLLNLPLLHVVDLESVSQKDCDACARKGYPRRFAHPYTDWGIDSSTLRSRRGLGRRKRKDQSSTSTSSLDTSTLAGYFNDRCSDALEARGGHNSSAQMIPIDDKVRPDTELVPKTALPGHHDKACPDTQGEANTILPGYNAVLLSALIVFTIAVVFSSLT